MKEIRVISKNKLRELCINHKLYTRGVDLDYGKLFFIADSHFNPTLNDILDLATYIFKYSDDPCKIFGLSKHDSIKTIASLILNSCCFSYVVD